MGMLALAEMSSGSKPKWLKQRLYYGRFRFPGMHKDSRRMTMRFENSMAGLALLLLLPATALALATESFGNKPAANQPDWAQGVVDVVNMKSRIYSQWVNGNENFYYRGNAQALNEALHKYAAVKADVRQVILMPGTATAQSFDGKRIAYDWKFHVPSGI
jgi:hypothetical protein